MFGQVGTGKATGEKTGVSRCYGVYLRTEVLTDGALTIMGIDEFSRRLWAGEVF